MSNLAQLFTDLNIDWSDLQTDPANMVKKIHAKGMWLATELDKGDTLQELETKFKKDAYANEPARERAYEIMTVIRGMIVDEDAAVIANLLTMLPEVLQTASNQVKTMSVQGVAELSLSKKHLHLMYTQLKKGYETYVSFVKAFHKDLDVKFPSLPAKSGNYGGRNHEVKIYRIHIDGDVWTNPFQAAKQLGLEGFSTYMDIIEMLQDKEEIRGFKVKLEEV
jgi:hypothetical protein